MPIEDLSVVSAALLSGIFNIIIIGFWATVILFVIKLLKKPSKPQNTLSIELLEKYRNEGKDISELLKDLKTPQITQVETKTVENKNSWSFSNWYAHNNILFTLYLGATLIILAAMTFVGFNWTTIAPHFKVLALIATCLGFFVCGQILFFKSQQLREAGVVFSTIGSLLIPVCGIAYYNFLIKGIYLVGFGWVAIGYIIFLGVFALDIFEPGRSLLEILTGLLIHLMPNFILIIVLILAYKIEKLGGLIFILLSLLMSAFFNNPFWVNLALFGPLFLIGALFIIKGHFFPKERR